MFDKEKKAERFISRDIEGSSLTDSGQRQILVDKETGVNYLFVHSGYAGGLTVLVDADGKPIVTPISD
ncbi:MAG: hypothetical protein IJ906_11095 [Oscillospiraceae bacterium]|nr:hypothetical protein [Oscillospiraceae bacterium]